MGTTVRPAYYDADGLLCCPDCGSEVYQFEEGETCSACDWVYEHEPVVGVEVTMNAAANRAESNAVGLAGTTGPSGHPSGSAALSAASVDAHTAQVQRPQETGPGHATITT